MAFFSYSKPHGSPYFYFDCLGNDFLPWINNFVLYFLFSDSTSSVPSFEDSDSDSDANDFSDSGNFLFLLVFSLLNFLFGKFNSWIYEMESLIKNIFKKLKNGFLQLAISLIDSEGSQEEWSAGRSSRESRQHRKDQFFWQYNIQSKGPKGKRVKFGMEENPHKVQDFEDPVFDSSSASQLGTTIRHGGKARKGDGNDVSPNPKKLVQIGSQIKKLNKQINSFAPLSELPVSTRNKSKKEKNKLASR